MTDRFSAFRHSAYSRYFFSRFCTSLGVQIVSVSVGWQIYDQTQNAALLGWIGLVQFRERTPHCLNLVFEVVHTIEPKVL